MQTKQKPRWAQWAAKFALRHIDLGLAIAITLAGLTLFAFSGLQGNSHAALAFLQNIERRSLDLRFEMRGERPHDDRIVIVAIDEKTLQPIGSFPLPRSNYAKLVDQLSSGGARVIAFDATFPDPESNSAQQALEKLKKDIGPNATSSMLQQINALEAATDQDASFASALKNAGNVLLAHIFLDSQSNPKLAEEYFNIVWAHAFPQVLKVNKRGGPDFDMGRAWIENGGTVMAGAEANITKLAESAASFGFINIKPDPDGTLRHAF